MTTRLDVVSRGRKVGTVPVLEAWLGRHSIKLPVTKPKRDWDPLAIPSPSSKPAAIELRLQDFHDIDDALGIDEVRRVLDAGHFTIETLRQVAGFIETKEAARG